MSQSPSGHQSAARFTAVTGPYELDPGPYLFTDWRFNDCDPTSGDHLSQPVTWNGRTDVGYAENQSVYFRFKMRCAKNYAFAC